MYARARYWFATENIMRDVGAVDSSLAAAATAAAGRYWFPVRAGYWSVVVAAAGGNYYNRRLFVCVRVIGSAFIHRHLTSVAEIIASCDQ